MTYHNATKFLLSSPDDLPEAILGSRLRRFFALLGNPQKKLTYFRIAGNSGKTVCSQMLTSIFRYSDYSVGCLTMPLRDEIRENIRINHVPLSIPEMAELVGEIYSRLKELNKTTETPENTQPHEEPLVLTKYEILLCTAILAFAKHGCKLCIIESGNIPHDPTRYLPAPIAAAICGTIPSDNPQSLGQIRSYLCHGIQEIVSAPQDQDAYHIISHSCAAINCRLTLPTKTELQISKCSLGGSEFCYRGKPYKLALCGRFQITNALVVLEIITVLSRHGYSLDDTAVVAGLQNLKLPCKLEILSVSPTFIADSTYSPESIDTVCSSLAQFREQLGSRICLCLPDVDLAERYETTLRANGFSVDTILLHGMVDAPAPYCAIPRLRDTVAYLRAHAEPRTVWLISGHHPFTAKLRYELLQSMGF